MLKTVLLASLTASSLVFGFQERAYACARPNPGKYWHGWGTKRLIVPKTGEPYLVDNGVKTFPPSQVCLDESGRGAYIMEAPHIRMTYQLSPD